MSKAVFLSLSKETFGIWNCAWETSVFEQQKILETKKTSPPLYIAAEKSMKVVSCVELDYLIRKPPREVDWMMRTKMPPWIKGVYQAWRDCVIGPTHICAYYDTSTRFIFISAEFLHILALGRLHLEMTLLFASDCISLLYAYSLWCRYFFFLGILWAFLPVGYVTFTTTWIVFDNNSEGLYICIVMYNTFLLLLLPLLAPLKGQPHLVFFKDNEDFLSCQLLAVDVSTWNDFLLFSKRLWSIDTMLEATLQNSYWNDGLFAC